MGHIVLIDRRQMVSNESQGYSRPKRREVLERLPCLVHSVQVRKGGDQKTMPGPLDSRKAQGLLRPFHRLFVPSNTNAH